MNLSGKPDSCTDANFAAWKTRFIEVANAIRTASPSARIILCLNEGLGSGALSTANQAALASGSPPPITTCWRSTTMTSGKRSSTRRRPLRSATPRPSAPYYWLAPRPGARQVLRVAGWGVSSGSWWARAPVATMPSTSTRPRLVRHQLGHRRGSSVTSRARGLPEVRHHHHGQNPSSRTAYRTKIARYATGTGTGRRHGVAARGPPTPQGGGGPQEDLVERLPVTGVPARATEIACPLGRTPRHPGRVHQLRAGLVHGLARIAAGRGPAGHPCPWAAPAAPSTSRSGRASCPVSPPSRRSSRRVAPAWTGSTGTPRGRPYAGIG